VCAPHCFGVPSIIDSCGLIGHNSHSPSWLVTDSVTKERCLKEHEVLVGSPKVKQFVMSLLAIWGNPMGMAHKLTAHTWMELSMMSHDHEDRTCRRFQPSDTNLPIN
jgi:hypothetical protein